MEGLIPKNELPSLKTVAVGSKANTKFVYLASIQLLQLICYLKIGHLRLWRAAKLKPRQ